MREVEVIVIHNCVPTLGVVVASVGEESSLVLLETGEQRVYKNSAMGIAITVPSSKRGR